MGLECIPGSGCPNGFLDFSLIIAPPLRTCCISDDGESLLAENLELAQQTVVKSLLLFSRRNQKNSEMWARANVKSPITEISYGDGTQYSRSSISPGPLSITSTFPLTASPDLPASSFNQVKLTQRSFFSDS